MTSNSGNRWNSGSENFGYSCIGKQCLVAVYERIQKACLKVILGDMYIDYVSALEMCGLEPLATRREARCLDFALKCLKHKKNSRLFPLNQDIPACKVRDLKKFEVNFARTSAYMKSTIPYCQRLLNKHYSKNN